MAESVGSEESTGNRREGFTDEVEPSCDPQGRGWTDQVWEVDAFLTRGARSVQQPIRVGVPLPEGRYHGSEARLELIDPEGKCYTPQTEILARWTDGSVRWLLLDWIAPPTPRQEERWRLRIVRHETPQQADLPRVRQSELEVVLESNGTTFRALRTSPIVIVARGSAPGASLRIEPRLIDRLGRVASIKIDRFDFETTGSVRCTMAWRGRFAGASPCRFSLRACWTVGTGLVRIVLVIHNPRAARHCGGLWDLGDPGSIYLRDLSLIVEPSEEVCETAWTLGAEGPAQRMGRGKLEIVQESSGGENWRSEVHLNRFGEIPMTRRGFRVVKDGQTHEEGLRASPTVATEGPTSVVSVAIPRFWEEFPKSIRVDGQVMELGLFPREFPDLHELQGGERKSHECWIDLTAREGTDLARSLDFCQRPAAFLLDRELAEASAALPVPVSTGPGQRASQDLDVYLNEAMDGVSSLGAKRETIDEYGWRNFGEIYADHEQAFYRGSERVVSHYNNQYDLVLGTLIEAIRTGDARWTEFAFPLARHVADIDVYHTTEDRAAYSGGLFWLTDHYVTAHTCTHRTYSGKNTPKGQDYGGGPSSNHLFTTGLMLAYYMTGEKTFRDTLLELAEWVLRMDDGRTNLFGLIDDGPTGLASMTASEDYHGPGRGAGNSIRALLDAWELTNQPRYLEAAESLIRRTIHPEEDPSENRLDDFEARWSYTMYLATLLRYVGAKERAGQHDFMHNYAIESLRTYGHWMLEHERPYFDQRESMEYPTEAWAGQELRKANVLRQIASYECVPEVRERLWRRGMDLSTRAWSDLRSFPTAWSARAIALVLSEGPFDAQLRAQSGPAHRTSVGQFQPIPRTTFIPQKRRVMTTLRRPKGLGTALLRVSNPAVWVRWLRSRRTSGSSFCPE